MKLFNTLSRLRKAAVVLFLPIAATALLAVPHVARAAILNVPLSYPTIQAGINAASSGDTVLVAQGTYKGAGNFDIDLAGKNITVQSSDGAANTVIDMSGASATNQEHAFDIHSGETSAAIIQGFTIQNGFFDNGAITISDSSPTIEQCIFLNNTSGALGGAIDIEENNAVCNPTIEQCVFVGNIAGDLTSNSGFGGAIECVVNTSNGLETVNIINSVFIDNTATYDGGAIDVSGNGNTSPTVNVVNCSFTNNNADGFVSPSEEDYILPPSAGQQPGAIDSFEGSVTITNSVLWGDTTSVEYSTLNDPATSGGGSLGIDHSDIDGGYSGAGNINGDPLFVDANGDDLRPLYNSPAINVGESTNPLVPAVDLNGNSRDASPDMGAYEYVLSGTSTSFNPTQNDPFSGQVATFVDSTDLTSPVSAYSAVIEWGDSTESAGTITQPSGSGTAYSVTGSHAYEGFGVCPVTVVISAATNAPSVTTSTATDIVVNQQFATHLVVTAPASAIVGSPFSITVTAEDADNITVPGYLGTVAFTSSDGAATLPANATLTNGVGTFPVVLGTGGSQTVTATDTSVPTITGTSNAIIGQIYTSLVVTPGPVLVMNPPLPQQQQFAASANDQFGNPMVPQPAMTWSLAGGSVGSIGGTSGLYHSGTVSGTTIVKVKAGAFTSTVTVYVNPPVTVATPAVATPNPVTGTTTNLSVLGGYNGNGGAGVLTYTWSSTGPSPVVYSVNGTNAAANTVATFSIAGSYTLTVTITGPYGSTTSSVNVTVNQTLTSIAVTPGPTVGITPPLPQTQQFAATAYDQFGNPMSVQPAISWTLGTGSVGSITSAGGLYHSGTVTGTAVVKAKSGAVTGTATVLVNPPVTVATPAAANPNPVTGTTTNLSALGGYIGTGGAGILTYTWASDGPGPVNFSVNGTNAAANTVATFSQAGNYTVTVTIAGPYGSATSSVSVTVSQTLTSITVSPGPTVAMTPPLPQSQQFTATANDQFGTPLATQPTFTWSLATGSVGSISLSTGLYHSGTVAGSATVKAKSGAVTGTATVYVNPPVTVSQPAAASPNPVTGTTTNLSALGAYLGTGGAGILTYTWASDGPGPVNFSVNGTNAASSTVATFSAAGSYEFTVTITGPYGSTTSSVNVTVNQTLTSITVTPGPTLTINPPLPQTQQFTAMGYDQFLTPLATQPAFTWSLSAGGVGSIGSAGGLYHSGTVAGSATVKAKSGTVTGTTAVSVN